ncbi:DUF6545 domain-containing protein [Nocardia sp. NPDC051463]|uniref:DUF6545 domain-containing protein n=1 Tax=Nocardia sp. NPDC051463 TaxID=3154845 RepID=UPI00341D7868
MTVAIPTAPAVGITASAVLVAALRWKLVNDSGTDRLINRALGLAGAGMLLGIVTTGSRLAGVATSVGAVVGFLTVASIYGVARLADGANPVHTRRRQRRYDLVALTGAGLTLLIKVAAELHLVSAATATHGQSLGMALSCLPLALSGFLVMRASFREIRCTDSPPSERTAYACLLGVASFWIVYAAILLVRYCRGISPEDAGAGWALGGFVFFALIVALLGIPLVRMLLVRIGWDRDSRHCRRLHPLWADLTAAVPHIALAPRDAIHQGPAERRYRMTIEIRDALLHLRRQVPGSDADLDDIRSRTLRFVDNAQAALPTAPVAATGATSAVRRELESRHLLELARQWPKTKRATDRIPRVSASQGTL